MTTIQPYYQIDGKTCIAAPALLDHGIVSEDTWANWTKRINNGLVRKGGNGRFSLFDFNMIPHSYQQKIVEVFGKPKREYHPLKEHFKIDTIAQSFYQDYTHDTGEHLSPAQIARYTMNASMIKALLLLKSARTNMQRRMQNSQGDIWQSLAEDAISFQDWLKADYNGAMHDLPTHKKRLQRKVADFAREGYAKLIDGRAKNTNAAKVETEEQVVVIEELLKKHQHLDNQQIKKLYNTLAKEAGWKAISGGTVARFRKEFNLYIASGNSGETNFRNRLSMQVKRTAPSYPLYYWTLDGWDAELLYQRVETDKNGRSVTTYHNRLTVVVVLDPCCKYPIGYAIGTHETPALIKQALRNAANHTQQLFGVRYKPHQLQSDNYGRGALTPIYEAMARLYTPARVKNAKAKVIEPYFLSLNKNFCQLQANWSGFGITARKESQPNADYLNKIRHSFPDEEGCRAQLVRMIEIERRAKRNEYLDMWEDMPHDKRLPMAVDSYLHLFGETTGFTNRLEPSGFNPTILGQKRSYDTYDVRFRELRHIDWIVKYDPENSDQVLVVNAVKKDGKIIEKATHRFLLTATYLQPMALIERTDGDAAELQKVRHFNQELEESIIERGAANRKVLDRMFEDNPKLNDTLTKLVLCDSQGQHKDQRNKPRAKAIAPVKSLDDTDYEIIEENVRTQY